MTVSAKRIEELEQLLANAVERVVVLEARVDVQNSSLAKLTRVVRALCDALEARGVVARSRVIGDACRVAAATAARAGGIVNGDVDDIERVERMSEK